MILTVRIACMILFTALIAYGQPELGSIGELGYGHEHLSIKNGLPNNKVFSIFQDPQGYMWFGTRNGLAKYDGYEFSVYKKTPGNSQKTLSYNGVTDFVTDAKGKLWAGTFGGGINNIDVYTGEVTSYRVDKNQSNERDVCYQVISGKNGLLWIASKGGLNCFDTKTGTFKLFSTPDTISPEVLAIHEDLAGTLWVGTKRNLYKFNTKYGIFSEFSLTNIRTKPIGIAVIYPGKTGFLWMASKKGELFYVDVLRENFRNFSVSKKLFEHRYDYPKTSICTDEFGNLWIAPSNNTGIYILDPVKEKWRYFSVNKGKNSFLHSNTIYSLYKSRSGIIWIGTNNGVEKIYPTTQKFKTVQLVKDEDSFREYENSVRVSCIDKLGIVWLVNDNGNLYSYNKSTSSLQKFNHLLKNEANKIEGFVISICLDKQDNLWVATAEYIYRYNKDSNTFERFRPGFPIKIIQKDLHGNIWIFGTQIASFDTRTHIFTKIKSFSKSPFDMASASLRASTITKDGDIWLAYFRQGLVRFSVNTTVMTFYKGGSDSKHLNDNDVHAIYAGINNVLWIGTHQGGLNKLDLSTGTFSFITSNDGLPSNQIEAIQQDQSGLLWLGTSQGLCRYNTANGVASTFYESDGLQDDEFQEASAVGQNGEMVFGGPDGFNLFNPKSIKPTIEVPPIYISSFKVNNKEIQERTKQIILSHNDNNVSFEFISPTYILTEQTNYSYKLEGIDKSWSYSGNRRFVSYSNLPPGQYSFHVSASNKNGIWNKKNAIVNFVVVPPIWQYWWFKSICAIFFFSIIFGVFRYRVYQIKNSENVKTAINKRLAEMEMKVLKAQMNPHFIFNSLNSINRFIMENEADIASDYLIKFSKLIRLILQHSNHQYVSLSSELEAIKLYLSLESLRFEHRFAFNILIDESVDTGFIEIPPLIIQPYVENAIWHGLVSKPDDGLIEIRICKNEDVLLCEIEDNGIGRAKAAEQNSKSALRSKSLGMEITLSRLQILNSSLKNRQSEVDVIDLYDQYGNASGTLVRLSIAI